MGLLLICSTILIQCDRNIRGSACRKSSCVSAPRIFCLFTLTALTSSMIHSHRQTPIWNASVFLFNLFFGCRTEDFFFFSKLLSSRKGLRENLAISVPPLLFYTSVTWVWSPFSRLSVVVHAILQLRNLRFSSFKLTCRPYWPGNMGSKKKWNTELSLSVQCL